MTLATLSLVLNARESAWAENSPLAQMSDADVTAKFWREQNVIDESWLSYSDFAFENVYRIDSQFCLAVREDYDRVLQLEQTNPSSEFKQQNLVHFREFFVECARLNAEKGPNTWFEYIPVPTLKDEKRKQLADDPSMGDEIKRILSQGFNAETMEKGRYLPFVSAGMLMLLMTLPNEVTNWSDDARAPRSFYKNWSHNTGAGPHMDKDSWVFNHLLHPVAGANQYLVARMSGESRFASFIFSVLISTFMWEFGVESVAERPSIQDLLITPIIGSILGEFAFQAIKKIEANGGQVLGSQFFASCIIWALSPLNKVIEHMRDDVIKPYGVKGARWRIYHGYVADTPLRATPAEQRPNPRADSGQVWGIDLNIPFDL